VPSLKRELFKALDEFCPPTAILASNTSSLNIFDIVEVSRPERLVVAHWFAPPHIIPLVEVVPGPRSSPDAVAWTAALMERIGKRPVVMRQFVPSFIVNRIQHAIGEAVMEMLSNGWATPEEIDLAVKSTLGIRLPVVGVVQSMDFTGLKLVYDIQKARGRVVPLIEEKVKAGHLGASASRGLYDYGGRTEEEILRKRDERYIKMLEQLERILAFEPI
jgi:3-hydroxybutyryl-CoA dehydrogenase